MKGKGLLCGLLALGLICGVSAHPAYADASGYQTVNVSYQDVVSGNTLTYTSWYNDDFFETNAENGKLAKLSVALAAQTYVSAESIAEAVTSMGFTVCLQKNYDRIPTSADCDFVAYTIASRQIGDATLYGVFLRGTTSDAQWYSNFNIGQSTVHRGFDTASQDVYNALSELITDNFDTNKIWIAGHSRGGAVGNLLAERIDSTDDFAETENVCAYNFGVPMTTTNPMPYENIFNYNGAGDIISAMPLEAWGFGLHGVTRVYSSELDETARAVFRDWTGVEYAGGSSTEDFASALLKWCPTRDDYYRVDAGFAPVDIITTYVVPALAGEATYSPEEILLQPQIWSYFLRHTSMIEVIAYFLDHSEEIVHAHAPVTYIAYTDAMYPHEHEFNEYISNEDATCTENGTETATCYCGEKDTRTDENSLLGHDYEKVSTAEDGTVLFRCHRCGKEMTKIDIAYAQTSDVADDEYLGEPIVPAITVSFGDKVLTEGVDYAISYADNDAVGTAKIVLEGLGAYTGEKVITFRIHAHVHVFEEYEYCNDATCTQDGTEKATCYCGATDVRTKPNTARGHNFYLSDVTDKEEIYACSRCDEKRTYRLISAALISIDEDKFYEYAESERGNAVWICFDADVLTETDYRIVSWNVAEDKKGYVVSLTVEGKGNYHGMQSQEIFVPYPPDPHAWVIWVSAAGAAAVGVGLIALGVVTGIRKRRLGD